MELTLKRTYYPIGTNGKLFLECLLICYTIELPYKENQKNISCIPQGTYELRKRTSKKFGEHIQIMQVHNRDCILIHPANNALVELRGCVAPVSQLIGFGRGTYSAKAFTKLKRIVFKALESGEKVYLKIEEE